MADHSSIVGGSTADRLLSCPGSFQATLALPPSVDTPSEYAEEGTAMHAVMTDLMLARQSGADAAVTSRLYARFHDRDLNQQHVDDMIGPALNALDELENQFNVGDFNRLDPFDVLEVEKSVRFPGIPGAFGTCDLILGNQTHLIFVDWKFGQGIGVRASYKDDRGEKLNPQMMFYTVAALHSARHLSKGRKVIIAIIQPRGADPLTFAEVSRQEIRWFTEDLQHAVMTAWDRNPLRVKGEHCRFAPCKINCPLWTGPLLDLSALGHVVQARTDTVSRETTAYGEYLARAKALVDVVEMFKKTLDEQLHAFLEDGGVVPGWRLKLKTKARQWIDEVAVEQELKALGFQQPEIWQKKLVTFAAADAAAKRHSVKIPDHLRVAPATNETTVCATDDPAPVLDRALVIEQFRASLGQLKLLPRRQDYDEMGKLQAGSPSPVDGKR